MSTSVEGLAIPNRRPQIAVSRSKPGTRKQSVTETPSGPNDPDALESPTASKEPKALGPNRLCRPPLERALRIHEEIATGTRPNCNQLARKIEVHRQTILRDIQFMRDRLNLPVAYDKTQHGYYYPEPVSAFPTLHVTESEALGIFLAEFAFESFPGFGRPGKVRNALSKLAGPAIAAFEQSREQLREMILFRTTAAIPPVDGTILPAIMDALLNSIELTFSYQKPNSQRFEPRQVRPLQLRWKEGVCYLVCDDCGAKGDDPRRTFALHRMKSAKLTNIRFERPKNFDPEQELAEAFGIHSGGKVEDVRLRFTAPSAYFAKERHWHRSQRVTDLPDGTVEMTLRVAVNPEFEQWVLGWGSNVQILEPASLRQTMREHAMRSLEQLDGDQSAG